MAEYRPSILEGIFFLVLSSALLWAFLWYRHHDAAVKGYTDGSVCSHQFDIDNAYDFSVAQHEASSTQADYNTNGNEAMYQAAASDAATAIGGERAEFQDIFGALLAANQALAANHQKPLFCAPPLTIKQKFALYDSYWAATKQRTKQDLAVCRRDFPTDILVFYTQSYPCH